MNVGKLAEDWVRDYFRRRGKVLIKARKGDVGYDFRSQDGKLFVEVKGTANSTLANTGFRYFTNTQYERARQCLRDKTRYEIHLIVGVGSDAVKHYVIPGKELVDRGKPEVSWSLPIGKGHEKYRLNGG